MASSPPNKLFPNQRGFPTPDTAPIEIGCRSFSIPSSEEYFALLMGALDALRKPYNWYQNGELTPEEAADAFASILDLAYEDGCGVSDVPAPYWEDGNEADDTMSPETQIWYGYVSEGNFIEDIGIFLVSNFLASTVSPQAAVLYATNERKVRLSFFNGGGVAGVVKVYAEEILAAVVNLTGDADEIIDVDVLTGYTDEAVEILQILDSVSP